MPLAVVEPPCRGECGENLARISRTHPSQEALAKASKVSRPMIAAIEAGHKKGGIDTLKKLAATLKIDLDNLA
jgi:transcriptional regulator with XRE-family HTH domain